MAEQQGALEGMVVNSQFWNGKSVLLTGHTGFKGSWLSLWLQAMGAKVIGFALAPPTQPNLFEIAQVEKGMPSIMGDVRNLSALRAVLVDHEPEIVIHMAAQALVRLSYSDPVETYSTNVMGSVNLLEAVRQTRGVKAVVNVTSDKCYENREWGWGYRENEPMGGFDPYSNSKGCAELVTAAYRNSFFPAERYEEHGVILASARAGNVIGGGDWATDRLIPDIMRAIAKGDPVLIRNPHAIRPWQHVLEPLSGYLVLAQSLYEGNTDHAEGWNFGPADEDARSVGWIVDKMTSTWGNGASWVWEGGNHPHEAQHLKLDCSKARARLGWRPRWGLEKALEAIVEWHRALCEGRDMRELTLRQIQNYTNS